MGPDARLKIRQCWRCDCDGKSHLNEERVVGAEKYAVDSMADVIERLTGHRPPTCPWRAMQDPLVGPVIRAAKKGERGLGKWLPDDPPAILADAVDVYLDARDAVRNRDDAEEFKVRAAKAEADAAKAKAKKRGWG